MSGKSIVIVGGGAAGYTTALQLGTKLSLAPPSQRHSITLIDARPYSIYLPAAARFTTTSEGHLEDTALLPYDPLFSKATKTDGVDGKVKLGRVVRIEQGDGKGKEGGEVVLESGERVKYDVLVLSPGCSWAGPLDFPDSEEGVKAHIEAWRKKFEAAKGVILVGGGSVGIEYAGELKDFFPDKKVTIVHNSSMLLNSTYSDKGRRQIERDLRVRGVDIIFDDRVDDVDTSGNTSGTVKTRAGKVIEGDLIVPTYGARAATSFVASLGSDVLNSSGQIKVNTNLRLPSFANIFALGDAIDWNEQKQMAKYTAHADVVAANVLDYLNSKAPSKQYKGSRELIVVTNGRNGGIGSFTLFFGWRLVLGAWFARLIKSRTLMIDIVRKRWGLDAK